MYVIAKVNTDGTGRPAVMALPNCHTPFTHEIVDSITFDSELDAEWVKDWLLENYMWNDGNNCMLHVWTYGHAILELKRTESTGQPVDS